MKKRDDYNFNLHGMKAILIVIGLILVALVVFVGVANLALEHKEQLAKIEMEKEWQRQDIEKEKEKEREANELYEMQKNNKEFFSVKYAGTNSDWNTKCKKIDSEYVGALFGSAKDNTRFGVCTLNTNLIVGESYRFTVYSHYGTPVVMGIIGKGN